MPKQQTAIQPKALNTGFNVAGEAVNGLEEMEHGLPDAQKVPNKWLGMVGQGITKGSANIGQLDESEDPYANPMIYSMAERYRRNLGIPQLGG